MIQIDRRHFIASLGGAAAVKLMSSEARAEALEAHMMAQLNTATAGAGQTQPKKFPKAAEVEAQIETRHYRRAVGNPFLTTEPNRKEKKLQSMPGRPASTD